MGVGSLLIIAAIALAFENEIEVAPNLALLDSRGQVVTVRADVAYSPVCADNVQLDGLPIHGWRADNRGNVVAKFTLDDVRNMVDVGQVTLTLTGVTRDGEEFSGSGTIRVTKSRN